MAPAPAPASASVSSKNTVIKFYASWSCSYAQRVWITLNHLNIPYDFIESFIFDKEKNENVKDPNLLKLNPKGTVPTLDVNGEVVLESIAIVEYLHRYSGNNNVDPSFVTTQLMEDANSMNEKITPNMFGVFKRKEEHEREVAWNDFVAGFKTFSEHIQENGFFKSATMNVVDITIFPVVMRLCYLERFKGKKLDGSLPWVQNLMEWRERMLSNNAVSATVADEEKLLEWFRNRLLQWGVVV